MTKMDDIENVVKMSATVLATFCNYGGSQTNDFIYSIISCVLPTATSVK